jgi:predicted hydrocarbon binding protein
MTNEDIMDVFKAQKEVGNKYITPLTTLYAQLFCTIAEELITQCGEEGGKALINAVQKFGEKRGRKRAEIVKSLGKENSLKNFFIYGDSDDMSELKLRLKLIDGNPEIIVRDCAFCNGCKEWGKEEYGNIYCEYIDKSMLKGYNPHLKLEMRSFLTKGDKNCILEFYSP